MTDTPKFTVVDRRKFRDADDPATTSPVATATPLEPAKPASEPAIRADSKPEAKSETKPGPRLTLVESTQPKSAAAVADALPETSDEEFGEDYQEATMPPAPTAEESRFQKAAYEASAARIDDLVRAQNPAAPAPEKIGFEHLVQQLYVSALMQMGAGTPEGQRPRIDILGARQTIDLIAVLAEKTKGNLTPDEDRALQTVLYELRMTFLELTRMIASQPQAPLPPPPGGVKR
jgi:hypothetical protein